MGPAAEKDNAQPRSGGAKAVATEDAVETSAVSDNAAEASAAADNVCAGMPSGQGEDGATTSVAPSMPSPAVTAAEARVRLSGVRLTYDEGKTWALDGVDLTVRVGERLCVLGCNGSGKSTLAQLLAGLEAPDAGRVELAGQLAYDEGEVDAEAYRAARHRTGLVFQNPEDQIVTSVVADDVAFGPENLGIERSEIVERVDAELGRVALGSYAQADPARLSGGQQQRVAIASALAMHPDMLVLDEPGAMLDVRGRRGIMRVLANLHEAGTTIVHITHFMDEALAADRVVVLRAGKIVLEGTPDEVFRHAGELLDCGLELPISTFASLELGLEPCSSSEQLANALAAQLGRDAASEENDAEAVGNAASASSEAGASGASEVVSSLPLTAAAPLAEGGAGRGASASMVADNTPGSHAQAALAASPSPEIEGVAATAGKAEGGAADRVEQTVSSHAVVAHAAGAAPALRLSHVCFSYVEKAVLDDLSLEVAAGELVALLGCTGSGKSTIARLACALEAPSAGTVEVCGISTQDRKRRRELRGKIGFVMQRPERQLFAETVFDDVAYGPRNLGLSADEVTRRVNEQLEFLQIAHKAQASPFELSGGQQRMVALAGVLAMNPEVLVLDEPVAGLDPSAARRLRRAIRSLHERGTAILLISHSMEDVARLADRVVALDHGRIGLDGSPSHVFRKNEERLHGLGLGVPATLSLSHELEGHLGLGRGAFGSPLRVSELVRAVGDLRGERA